MSEIDKYLELSKNYVSDGCTNAPDFNIRKCCVMHDYLLETEVMSGRMSRRKADVLFFKCMWRKYRFPLALYYFITVRVYSITESMLVTGSAAILMGYITWRLFT